MSPSPNPNQFPESANNPEQPQAPQPPVVRRPNPPKSAPTPKSEPTATGEPKTTGESIPPKSTSTPKSEATPKSVLVGKSEPKKAESAPTAEFTPTPTADTDTTSSEASTAEQDNLSRLQPIPPPSEPLQYRAIGLVRGKYLPSEEQFTRGNVLAADGRQIDAVLLGRVMSLVKNHLDLASEHLWVVYPRTRQEQGDLHVQIVGVWEPEKLDKERLATSTEAEATPAEAEATSTEAEATPTEAEAIPTEAEATPTEVEATSTEAEATPTEVEAEDGYFSIRGEVVFQSQDQGKIIVKIRQAAKKESDKPKFFKLTLNGLLDKKAVGYFWDFQVIREADSLVIREAKDIASVRQRRPGKPRPGGKRFGGGGGPGGKKPWKKDRPHRPGSPDGTSAPPGGARPIQKPIPRPKPKPPAT
ncbi:hypothetical protein ACE1B6_06460 [Aerosakkonemataceae cyanobacterium BLCC-F154]|uniref:Uncharacterized protein n=1 Tax=Floridaenema fluviatile BLCC-F154 TaxID=3153640 RepID=A0ABV4Y9I5_9CYAN